MRNLIPLNSIERNTLLILIAWTGILALSLWNNITHEQEHLHKIAVNEIRSNFEDIDTFRGWIAAQGGVYIPTNSEIPPNPVLEHLPRRDIKTTSGKELTLINSPYLLKHLSMRENTSFNAHMMSISPLNPANKADSWEKKALLSFEEGKEEWCEIVDYKGGPHMRLIRPAKFEERCAACHTGSNYRNGDILGGLTVSIPMQPYFDQAQLAINQISVTHGLLWFIGITGIGMVYRSEKKNYVNHIEAEAYLKRTSVAFDNLDEGVMILDDKMNVLAINHAFSDITDIQSKEIINTNLSAFKENIIIGNKHNNLIELLQSDKWHGDIDYLNKSNKTIPLHLSSNTVYNNESELTNYILVFSDIRERKNFEKTLEHLAQHDHLTGLPNRLLLNDRLEQSIIRAERKSNRTAILFLDLDHFKNINDSLGHHTGDDVLIQITDRLKNTIRKEDTLARLGGDEFIVLMEQFESNDDITVLADKLIQSLEKEFEIDKQKYYLGVSIGISIYPDHGETVSELISKADIAMYEAKSNGRNNYKFYTPEIDDTFRDRVKLETDLHNAIENDEFVLHFQPQLSIKSNNIIGAECLVRWQHPEYGMIYPDNFIHTAEELDLMVPIGELIIDKACAQMRAWLDEGIDIGLLAINVSGKQINNSDLSNFVRETLEKYELPSERLELEVTENYIMHQAEQSIFSLEKLRDSSVHISIDDFGTGYSSLNYLKKLPINKIKIDRSFIDGIPFDQHDKAIINAVIAIGQSLNFKVIAEGVENPEQLSYLNKVGCDEYQGYYCSKPIAATEFEALFAQHLGKEMNN